MCAVVLFPAAGSEGPRWLKIKSPNFELFTTAGERNGREVARHFEQVRAFFLEAMGLGLKSGPPVRIVVFRSDKEFAPYAPNELASAFYLGTDDHDYIIMKGASGEDFPVAVHEYTHLLLKHSGMRPPVWFNEGGDRGECAGQSRPGAGTVQRAGARQPQGLADRGRAGTAEPAGTEDRRGRAALRARGRTGQHERQNVS